MDTGLGSLETTIPIARISLKAITCFLHNLQAEQLIKSAPSSLSPSISLWSSLRTDHLHAHTHTCTESQVHAASVAKLLHLIKRDLDIGFDSMNGCSQATRNNTQETQSKLVTRTRVDKLFLLECNLPATTVYQFRAQAREQEQSMALTDK